MLRRRLEDNKSEGDSKAVDSAGYNNRKGE